MIFIQRPGETVSDVYYRAVNWQWSELRGWRSLLSRRNFRNRVVYEKQGSIHKCRQCRKANGRWTGPRVCGCGNPYINVSNNHMTAINELRRKRESGMARENHSKRRRRNDRVREILRRQKERRA